MDFDRMREEAPTTRGLSKPMLISELLYHIICSPEPLERIDDYLSTIREGRSKGTLADYAEAIDWALAKDMESIMFPDMAAGPDDVRRFLVKLKEEIDREITQPWGVERGPRVQKE